MADYEPPSFSLGLDLFFDLEPQIAAEEPPPAQDPPRDSSSPTLQDQNDDDDEEEEEFGPLVADSDRESGPEPPRVLKRLRRGPPHLRETTPSRSPSVGEDEIEELSSQEDVLGELHPPTQYGSMCSSSKIPLHGCGVITKSTSEWNTRKNKNEPVSTATASATAENSHDERLFPKLTISPLRRFQLIDCDSDDPYTSEEVIIRGNPQIDQSSKKQQSNPGQSAFTTTGGQIRNALESMPQSVDLWKDFCPIKSFRVPTPALDEMCKEYFQSVNDKNASGKLGSNKSVKSSSDFRESTNGRSFEQPWNAANPVLPAHRYFLHHDPRIRKLVRNRLPNFFPLGIDENDGNRQNGASVIDYMGQFGNRETSKRQATHQVDLEISSKRGRTKASAEKSLQKQSNMSRRLNAGEALNASESWVDPKQGKAAGKKSVNKSLKNRRNTVQTSSAGEGLHDSGGWLDPRSSASSKKNSGKQGSCSNGQSVGQWYTGTNGRKVYVNKNGQELTGQTAYRQYKKDRGGFNKTKRKTSSKKKKN